MGRSEPGPAVSSGNNSLGTRSRFSGRNTFTALLKRAGDVLAKPCSLRRCRFAEVFVEEAEDAAAGVGR